MRVLAVSRPQNGNTRLRERSPKAKVNRTQLSRTLSNVAKYAIDSNETEAPKAAVVSDKNSNFSLSQVVWKSNR